MAKTIEQLSNKIRIKWNSTTGLYHIYYGNQHVLIQDKGNYNVHGFLNVAIAKEYAEKLTQVDGNLYCKNNNFPFKTTTI